ncbi:MAG: tetratricopeptide repeat protein, partial [Promethearchaeota archaeon]
HRDIAFCLTAQNLEKKENYDFKLLKNFCKLLLKSFIQKIQKTFNSGDYFHVELVIDPVINLFEDYENNLTICIHMGFNYYYDPKRKKMSDDCDASIVLSTISEIAGLIYFKPREDLSINPWENFRDKNVNKSLLDDIKNLDILKLMREFNAKKIFGGICQDSSYVEAEKQKLYPDVHIMRFKLNPLEESVVDRYIWFEITELQSKSPFIKNRKFIDKSIIYGLFPKEEVTLKSNTEKSKLEHLHIKAKILIENKKLEEALTLIEKALKIEPNNAELISTMGFIHLELNYKKKNEEEVFSLLKKGVEINDKSPLTWYYLGIGYHKRKRYNKAIECYEKALEYNPKYKEVFKDMANSYICKEEFELALLNIKKALKIDPNYKKALTLLLVLKVIEFKESKK